MFELLNWICWLTVIIIFTVSAIYNIVRGPKVIKHNYINIIIWTTMSVFFISIIEFLDNKNLLFIVSYYRTWLSAIGSIFLIVGTVFSLWSRWSLGSIWTISPTIKYGHRLVTSGPYSVTRNPIYTGLMTMFLGSVFMRGFRSLLYYFIVTLIVFEIKIVAEEKILINEFKDEYIEYKKRVPRLIPNVFKLFS